MLKLCIILVLNFKIANCIKGDFFGYQYLILPIFVLLEKENLVSAFSIDYFEYGYLFQVICFLKIICHFPKNYLPENNSQI